MKHNVSNAVGYSDSSAQREIYSIEYIFSKEDLKLIIKVSTSESQKKKNKINTKQAEGRKC